MAGIYFRLRFQTSPEAKSAQWVSGIFPWGLSNRRTKLTSQAQSALIVRI
jgi:hypothetical protein